MDTLKQVASQNNTPLIFGTDGIRGQANTGLFIPESMVRLGRTLARTLQYRQQPLRMIVGRDTRRSGVMLQSALESGFLSEGGQVVRVEVAPTPALSFLTQRGNFPLGAMITASHNPASDNGVKFFDSGGCKIDSVYRQQIGDHWQMALQESSDALPSPGAAHTDRYALQSYLKFLKRTLPDSFTLKGYKIVLDCAHGAAYQVAPQLLQSLEAETTIIGNRPNGDNINLNCGVLAPQQLLSALQSQTAHIGVALDGDGDRIGLAIPQRIISGDEYIYLCAADMQRRGELRNNTIVVTEQSGMGLLNSLRELGIQVEVTGVGDHVVAQRMREVRASFGGESSGHIIFGEYASSGDALLAALQILFRFPPTRWSEIDTLLARYRALPQVTTNLQVRSKPPFSELPTLQQTIADGQKLLGAQGRLLVRYSGTESKIRILAEHPNLETAQQVAQMVTQCATRLLA